MLPPMSTKPSLTSFFTASPKSIWPTSSPQTNTVNTWELHQTALSHIVTHFIQPFAETLIVHLLQQLLFTIPNPSNPSHLLLVIQTDQPYWLFHGVYTPYSTSASYILPSFHETDQANSNSSLLQIILQYNTLIPILPCYHLCLILPEPTENFLQNNLCCVFHGFPYHILSIQ